MKQADDVDARLKSFKTDLFKSVSGDILELGPGTGSNFRYLPKDISWTGVEPNEELSRVLLRNPERIRGSVVWPDIQWLGDEAFDFVISTLVLCSVPHLAKTLQEIKRVLKPGGRLLCIEHVGAERGTLLRGVQRLVRPLSRYCGGGCEPDRDIGGEIYRTCFSHVNLIRYRVQISQIPIKVPLIRVIATK